MLLCTKIHVSLDTMATKATNMFKFLSHCIFFSQLNPSVSDFTGIGCRCSGSKCQISRLQTPGFYPIFIFYYPLLSKTGQSLLFPRGTCHICCQSSIFIKMYFHNTNWAKINYNCLGSFGTRTTATSAESNFTARLSKK